MFLVKSATCLPAARLESQVGFETEANRFELLNPVEQTSIVADQHPFSLLQANDRACKS